MKSGEEGFLARALSTPMDFRKRADGVRSAIERAGLDGLLITELPNIRYLSGFSGSAALLLISADAMVITSDGRYGEQMAEELAASRMDALTGDAVIGNLVTQMEAIRSAVTSLGSLPGRNLRIGFEEDHVSVGQLRRLTEQLPEADLVPLSGSVEMLRRVKDDGEIARISAAATVADHALEHIRSILEEHLSSGAGDSSGGRSGGASGEGAGLRSGGRSGGASGDSSGGASGDMPSLPVASEAELAAALDYEMIRLGSSGPAFDTIVAGGPNGAKPHAQPGPRLIRAGETLVVDFGATVDGYRSDTTRTWCPGGPADATIERMLAVVTESQQAGLAAVAPGVPVATVDAACRAVIEAAGWGDAFTHSTGHGVGLDIHEAPPVAQRADDLLEENMVLTVEPGVYLPGVGGVRIEDTVVVRKGGCDILTHVTKAP